MPTISRTGVAHVYYEPAFSGISRHVAYLLEWLDRDDFDLWVVCSTSDEKIVDCLSELLPQDRLLVAPPAKIFSSSGFLATVRLIREQGIRILHAHNLQSAPWAYAAALVSGCPIVVFNPQVVNVPSRSMQFSMGLFLRTLGLATTRFIAVSQSQARLLADFGIPKSRICVIPNRIDRSEIYSRIHDTPETVRKRLGISDDTVAVCQIGRLVYQKDPMAFLRIAGSARLQTSNAVFFMVGEGPERDRLEDAAAALNVSDKVQFLGFRPDALEILNACDIAVLTSRWEGLPHSLIEAVMLGKPIVATDVPGNKDVIVDGQTGFLVRSEEEFADKLAILVESRELREEMGRRGSLEFAHLFDPGQMAWETAELYKGNVD